jgi:hypothetical protein
MYLGRLVDSDEPLFYDAADLTTHGVIVGMTGSGKTGLGVAMIEEALLSGIPCLVIDPKGDMGNLALRFPELRAEDFEPWVDSTEADRSGRSLGDLAAETAERWRRRLENFGIDGKRIAEYAKGSEVTVYTPGSGAGVPLNVLGSMMAPDLSWDEDAEVIREEIQSLVSSILTLAGVSSDPVSGSEHVLLSTIIETLWRQGKNLDLGTLIGQIPNPPFRKLGVFEVDMFISPKDRSALALKLNALLASPSFAAWMEGVPLDIDRLLGGSPTRAAVIYLAHLTEEERQFIVTLLLSKMVTWIRRQPGTSQLRALIYMDEVYGFAPPTANPPSKTPILTIFKQARAHGVGMILSSQNPVDLDYKAMGNAGTWMIGRLQTENDRRRIVEAVASGGSVDSAEINQLVSTLKKRRFVLHVTRSGKPQVFTARRPMSYRPGPLTRSQLTALRGDWSPAPDESSPPSARPEAALPGAEDAVPVAPQVAPGISVAYLDPGAPWAEKVGADPTGTRLEPAVAAMAHLAYNNAAAKINHREVFEAILLPLDGFLDEHEVLAVDHDDRDFREEPPPGATYALTSVDLGSRTFWSGLSKDLTNYLVAHQPARIFRNQELKLYSRIDEAESDFRERCRIASEDAADDAVARLRDRYKTRIERVQGLIRDTETRLRSAERETSSRRQQEFLAGAGDLLGQFLGGRSRSNPLGQAANRRTATQRAGARVDAEATKLTERQRELEALEDDLAREMAEIADRHRAMAEAVEEMEISAAKSNIRISELKLVWIPVA